MINSTKVNVKSIACYSVNGYNIFRGETMKEINIATILATKRREKGITQEELAAYIGVSKASVSKWETGQSYPDITFLPQLATYFNTSIDCLMGYSPQMSKEEIRKIYTQLCKDFATKPFEEVIEQCEELIHKYYSCFELLSQMAVLLINHFMLTPDQERQQEILLKIIFLCKKVIKESENLRLTAQMTHLLAGCYQIMNEPQEVVALLGEEIYPVIPDGELIAGAYLQMGNTKKAQQIVQASLYQHLLFLVSDLNLYMTLNADKEEQFNQALSKALNICAVFSLKELHPNTVLTVYLTAAQIFAQNNKVQNALEMVEKYTKVCTENTFPYTLHGDQFFNDIEYWFEGFDLGNQAPRNEAVIKESMVAALLNNPSFEVLKNENKFKLAIKQLKKL